MCFSFFKKNNISPLKIEYEELIKDFQGEVIKIFHYLEIPFPKNLVVKTDLVKQSGTLSEELVRKYNEIGSISYFNQIILKRIYRTLIKKFT